jgi:glucan endo-1,3-alpha-glucosidase
MWFFSFLCLAQVVVLAASVLGAGLPARDFEVSEHASGTKFVFAHFIVGLTFDSIYDIYVCFPCVRQVGIVASYTQDDWSADMQLAQGMGIDGFALNIGKLFVPFKILRF